MKTRRMFWCVSLVGLLSLPVEAAWLHVESAWVREAPPVAPVMVGYATVSNPGAEPIWITGAGSSSFGAVEMHETVEEDGMARMLRLNFVRLGPGQTVKFRPGGKHLMLFRRKGPLKSGDSVPFWFKLGNGEQVEFTAQVRRNPPK